MHLKICQVLTHFFISQIINVRTPSAIKAKVVFHSQARRIAGEDEAEAIRKNGIEYTLEQADLGTGGNTIDIQNIQYVGDPAFNKRDVIDFDVEFPGKELPTPNKGQMSWTLNANNELELNARLVNPQGVMMALISKWKVLPNSRTSFMIPVRLGVDCVFVFMLINLHLFPRNRVA